MTGRLADAQPSYVGDPFELCDVSATRSASGGRPTCDTASPTRSGSRPGGDSHRVTRGTVAAKGVIIAWLVARGLGEATVSYKLRDWLFSRQRYWGEPIPILHGPNGELRALSDDELPLLLPEVEKYRPASLGG